MATPSTAPHGVARRPPLAAVHCIAAVAAAVVLLAACSKGDRPAAAATDTAAPSAAASTTAASTPTASAPTASAAATPSSPAGVKGEADLERLQDYTLTMAKMDQWYAAMRNVAGVVRTHPNLKDSFASDGNDSIDEETARIEAVPEFKKAINDAGLSVHEFEMVMWTSLQAGMAQGAIDAGANRDSIMRNVKVNPDNLAFMKAHAAELKAKQKEMEKEIPQS